MLKNRILYCISLLAALVFALCDWIWIAALVMLIALFLPWLSLLLSIGMTKRIKYDITAPAAVRRGDELSVIICDNSVGAVLDYIVSIEMEDCSGTTSDWIADLSIGEKRAIQLSTEHCGAVICHVREAYACDYLGLFRFRLDKVSDAVIIIMPIPAQPVPTPVLSQITHTSYRPKYGGGFAEVHDMREYRPGDSMRDIHWKLSAKTDRLIVREPQVSDRGVTLLTIDLIPPSQAFDTSLDHLAWVCRWLCDNEIEFEVRWISPTTREVESFAVAQKSEITGLMRTILSEPVKEPVPAIRNIRFSGIGWHYHIGGEERAG